MTGVEHFSSRSVDSLLAPPFFKKITKSKLCILPEKEGGLLRDLVITSTGESGLEKYINIAHSVDFEKSLLFRVRLRFFREKKSITR